MSISQRYKQLPKSLTRLCGVTVAYLTFNQGGVSSNLTGATVQGAPPCAGTLRSLHRLREEMGEHIWKT